MTDRQLRLGVAHGAPRPLFSERILDELDASQDTPAEEDVARLLAELRAILEREGPTLPGANEAQTEERWIKPVLDALGFAWTVRPAAGLGGRAVELDLALFADDASPLDAEAAEGVARFHHALAISRPSASSATSTHGASPGRAARTRSRRRSSTWRQPGAAGRT